MATIKIVDNGCKRYGIQSDCYYLGRMWDNLAEHIEVIKPSCEANNVCTMIVSANGVVIDHIDVRDEPIAITNVLSRHDSIEISFTFANASGYMKNSEIRPYSFAEARKPTNFVPVTPEQNSKLDIVLGSAFVRTEEIDGIVYFYNANDVVVGTLDFSKLSGMAESDPTVPSWAKEPKKPSYDYQEILNTPIFSRVAETGSYNDLKDQPAIPSVIGLASESYVDNKASSTLTESKSYTDTKISDLVGSAPASLNTIQELATALKNNPDIITALNNAIATKQNTTDNTLNTTSKTIVGAINEVNSKIGSASTQLQNILGV